jgi:hypothetical protein
MAHEHQLLILRCAAAAGAPSGLGARAPVGLALILLLLLAVGDAAVAQPTGDAAITPLARGTADLPPRLDITIRPVRWQSLPEQVKQVYIGPDQRLWCVLSAADQKVSLELTKRSIAREFSQAMPQIIGARPALFEKSGRVWFIAEGGRTLLAYQAAATGAASGGRESSVAGAAAAPSGAAPAEHWMERRSEEGDPFVGNCPGQGRYNRAGENLSMEGRAFFVTDAGVATFDGAQWS